MFTERVKSTFYETTTIEVKGYPTWLDFLGQHGTLFAIILEPPKRAHSP
jgi:hypothetical protein